MNTQFEWLKVWNPFPWKITLELEWMTGMNIYVRQNRFMPEFIGTRYLEPLNFPKYISEYPQLRIAITQLVLQVLALGTFQCGRLWRKRKVIQLPFYQLTLGLSDFFFNTLPSFSCVHIWKSPSVMVWVPVSLTLWYYATCINSMGKKEG